MIPVIMNAVAVLVLVGFTFAGAWKGMLRTVAGLLVVVLSLAGAGIVASALSAPAAKLAAPVIEKRIEARMEEIIEEQHSEWVPKTLEQHSEWMPEVLERLSLEDLQELLGLLGVDQTRLETLVNSARRTAWETGTSLAVAAIEGLAQSALYGVLYVISFVVLSAGLRLLVRILDGVSVLPVFERLNMWGGAFVGFGEGTLLLAAAVRALHYVGVLFNGGGGGAIFQLFSASPLDVLKLLGV